MGQLPTKWPFSIAKFDKLPGNLPVFHSVNSTSKNHRKNRGSALRCAFIGGGEGRVGVRGSFGWPWFAGVSLLRVLGELPRNQTLDIPDIDIENLIFREYIENNTSDDI